MNTIADTSVMSPSQEYTISRTFNPDTFSIEWDLLLSTDHGIVQLSRFDGILDYNRGGLGEGEYYAWGFDIHTQPDTPGDGSGDGQIVLEREYGSKPRYKPQRVAESLNKKWFVPVLKKENKDIIAELTELELPPRTLRRPEDAVYESKVDNNRLVLNSVYGLLNLGYYDGLVSHITGKMLPVTIDPFISDDYEVLVDVKSDTPGLIETYRPEELLYFLETGQFTCYIEPDDPRANRIHLLADGREVTEPANESPW